MMGDVSERLLSESAKLRARLLEQDGPTTSDQTLADEPLFDLLADDSESSLRRSRPSAEFVDANVRAEAKYLLTSWFQHREEAAAIEISATGRSSWPVDSGRTGKEKCKQQRIGARQRCSVPFASSNVLSSSGVNNSTQRQSAVSSTASRTVTRTTSQERLTETGPSRLPDKVCNAVENRLRQLQKGAAGDELRSDVDVALRLLNEHRQSSKRPNSAPAPQLHKVAHDRNLTPPMAARQAALRQSRESRQHRQQPPQQLPQQQRKRVVFGRMHEHRQGTQCTPPCSLGRLRSCSLDRATGNSEGHPRRRDSACGRGMPERSVMEKIGRESTRTSSVDLAIRVPATGIAKMDVEVRPTETGMRPRHAASIQASLEEARCGNPAETGQKSFQIGAVDKAGSNSSIKQTADARREDCCQMVLALDRLRLRTELKWKRSCFATVKHSWTLAQAKARWVAGAMRDRRLGALYWAWRSTAAQEISARRAAATAELHAKQRRQTALADSFWKQGLMRTALFLWRNFQRIKKTSRAKDIVHEQATLFIRGSEQTLSDQSKQTRRAHDASDNIVESVRDAAVASVAQPCKSEPCRLLVRTRRTGRTRPLSKDDCANNANATGTQTFAAAEPDHNAKASKQSVNRTSTAVKDGKVDNANKAALTRQRGVSASGEGHTAKRAALVTPQAGTPAREEASFKRKPVVASKLKVVEDMAKRAEERRRVSEARKEKRKQIEEQRLLEKNRLEEDRQRAEEEEQQRIVAERRSRARQEQRIKESRTCELNQLREKERLARHFWEFNHLAHAWCIFQQLAIHGEELRILAWHHYRQSLFKTCLVSLNSHRQHSLVARNTAEVAISRMASWYARRRVVRLVKLSLAALRLSSKVRIQRSRCALQPGTMRRRLLRWRTRAYETICLRESQAWRQYAGHLLRRIVRDWNQGAKMSAMENQMVVHKQKLQTKLNQWLLEIEIETA